MTASPLVNEPQVHILIKKKLYNNYDVVGTHVHTHEEFSNWKRLKTGNVMSFHFSMYRTNFVPE